MPSLRNSLLGILVFLPLAAHAQNFTRIPHTPYYCATFLNGDEILVQLTGAGDYTELSQSKAEEAALKDLNKVRSDIRTDNAALAQMKKDHAISESSQNVFKSAQLIAYVTDQNSHEPKGIPFLSPTIAPPPAPVDLQTFPPGNDHGIAQLQTQITDLNKARSELESTIAAIEGYHSHCKKGKPDFFGKPLILNVGVNHTMVGILIYTIFPEAKDFSACLLLGSGANATRLGDHTISKNPCVEGGFNCSKIISGNDRGLFIEEFDNELLLSQSELDAQRDQVEQDWSEGVFYCGK